MTPEQKISYYFKSVKESDIIYDDGFYFFTLDVFGVTIRISGYYLDNYTIQEILELERALLNCDNELANHFRHIVIRRY